MSSVINKDCKICSSEFTADEIEIYGIVEGDICARKVKIGKTGVVKGNIFYQELKVENGGEIKGNVELVKNVKKK